MTAILVGLALVLVLYLLNAALLWGIARLLGGAQATYLRALGVSFALALLGLAFVAPMVYLESLFKEYATGVLWVGGFGLVIQIAVAMGMYQKHFGLTRWRSFFAFVVVSVIGAALSFMVALPLRMFAFEGFYIPTNAMAPTLLGRHRIGECPECGGPLVISASQEIDTSASPFGPPPDGGPEEGICQSCRHVGESTTIERDIRQGDRVLVDKLFAQPQRWDLLVFRTRGEKGELHVQRLVGMPGDTLELRHGELWINGATAVYAPEMVGLVYSPNSASMRPQFALSEGQTIVLENDEYFVLGDYSNLANDSRNYGPIRDHQIVGVVTAVYWPPTSWRVVR